MTAALAALARFAASCRSRSRLRAATAHARALQEARREADRIVAAAKADGDRIVAEAEALQASLAATVIAAQQTLAKINGHISEATQSYRRLEARRRGVEISARAGREPRGQF